MASTLTCTFALIVALPWFYRSTRYVSHMQRWKAGSDGLYMTDVHTDRSAIAISLPCCPFRPKTARETSEGRSRTAARKRKQRESEKRNILYSKVSKNILEYIFIMIKYADHPLFFINYVLMEDQQ